MRKGKVWKETDETVFAATTFTPQERDLDSLLQLARDHWSIENCRHHGRERTRDEDRRMVGETVTARNLSLFRSLAIFLFQRQRGRKNGRKSLPDFQTRNQASPWEYIRRFTGQKQT